MLRLWSARLLALAALFACTGPLAQAQSPFGKIPEKSPIIIKVPGLGTLTSKVGALLEAVAPDQAKKLKDQMTAGMAEGLKGRDLAGIDQTKPVIAFLANFENVGGDNPPNGGVLVPITKYADFKKVFTAGELKTFKSEDGLDALTVEEKTLYLTDLGEYAFLSPSAELVKEQKGKFPSLAGKFSKETEKAFADAGFCVLVNMTQINDTYGAVIQGGKQQVELLMGVIGGQMEKKQVEMVKELVLGGFQIVEDSKAILIGISMKPDGIALKFQGQFGKDTEIGNFLKDTKVTPLTALGALPAGKATYSGMQLSSKFGKALSKLAQQAAASDPDEAVQAKLDKAVEALGGAGQKGTYTFADLSPPSGLTVTLFDNADAALAAQLQMYGALTESSSFGNIPLKAKPTIKEAAEKADGLSFTMVKIPLDIEKAVSDPKIPEQMRDMMKAMYEKMTGDSMNFWLAKDDKSVVTITAKDWPAAQKIAALYAAQKKGAAAGSIGETPGFKITRAGLPADATLVSLVESASLISAMYDYFKSFGSMIPGADIGKIPELKIDKKAPKSFFGFSLSLKPEHGGLDLFIPTATIKEIVKMAKPLMKNED